MSTPPKGPVLIDMEPGKEDATPSPAEAPPVPDLADEPPTGAAMGQAIALTARRPSMLARWFWALLMSILTLVVSVWAWRFLTDLVASAPILGWIATGLVGLFLLVLLLIAAKELAAFSRLARIDRIHRAADEALEAADAGAARKIVRQMTTLYAGRDDTRWGRDRLAQMMPDQFDADGILALAENELLTPLDTAARAEVEAAARQVATVTALVPLALADVITALTANLRMIRRIAEVYGGRSGTLGSWRLTRAVMTHLVATGAVAVGDDLIGSVGGGHLLGKVSRRFGEGVVNGALTARVGVAAMEVCRPLPFRAASRPSVTAIVTRSLTGLFSR
ncbi:YcjF family protein [Pseudaestuariivita atlantica]|uniref:GTP-binding protein n=1 Tax=Pseudaestuariivita atlantica TaxID=1317121 RepID=A0A0L1JQU2_9RHOB|nr:TIGR01620 family protein [Pseudaestuariivita atlantica]KNG94106.1 GTP-binding protein [Pseudaestuariivita atlantica]